MHFATHALLNSRYPELSGIVLSTVDRSGRPQDGLLRLHEIYGLKLNADLVVLSGCQTPLGQEMRSEGLVRLPCNSRPPVPSRDRKGADSDAILNASSLPPESQPIQSGSAGGGADFCLLVQMSP